MPEERVEFHRRQIELGVVSLVEARTISALMKRRTLMGPTDRWRAASGERPDRVPRASQK
jgi:hypothetical protein